MDLGEEEKIENPPDWLIKLSQTKFKLETNKIVLPILENTNLPPVDDGSLVYIRNKGCCIALEGEWIEL